MEAIPNGMDLLAAALKSRGLETRFINGSFAWRFANASLQALADMRYAAVAAAVDDCERIARSAAIGLELGPCDPTGWPETPDGAAFHQSRAIASLIRESFEHETLRALASGMEAATAGETACGLDPKDDSPTAEGGDAQTPDIDHD